MHYQFSLRAHRAPVLAVAAFDQTLIASGGTDGIVNIIDLKDCSSVSPTERRSSYGDQVVSWSNVGLAFGVVPNSLYMQRKDGDIFDYDLARMKIKNQIGAGCLSFAKLRVTDCFVVAPVGDGTIAGVFDVKNPDRIEAALESTDEKAKGLVMSIAVCKDMVAAAFESRAVVIWDLRTSKTVQVIQMETTKEETSNPLTSLCFDLETIWVGDSSGKIYSESLSNTESSESSTLLSKQTLKSGVGTLAVSSSSCVCGTWNGDVGFWEEEKNRFKLQKKFHSDGVQDSVVVGNAAYVGSSDATISVWEDYEDSSSEESDE